MATYNQDVENVYGIKMFYNLISLITRKLRYAIHDKSTFLMIGDSIR